MFGLLDIALVREFDFFFHFSKAISTEFMHLFFIETTKKNIIAGTANIFDCKSCDVFPIECAGISL